ncbi:hypothetical protein CERSUDRAFT_81740 [Gelatoporia subvermispora B]|uniref:J domain-containing protein n=1 Tax=Ceriporiopsis subvermispora (strain B) TaxID=914234 RepID=M2RJJ1_CERS8|nr:hypothetical protein CERSUDRAFT_81740 [Gelatoporia subvermispora B]
MATNLYEVLGVNKNASPEEIRKAYRKRALQTHPDRIPPTATPDEKKAAEEQFRKVNNAYEVLTDDSNRKLYDRYGVWPPPEPSAEPQPNPRSNYHRATVDPFGSNPFSSDPFFSSGFGFGPHRPFTFTDPFVLFNSLFGDLHGAFEENPFFSDPFLSPFDSRSPFGMDPFERAMVSPFGSRSPFGSLFGPSPTMHGLPGSSSSTRSYSAVSRSIGMNGQWVSQSKMTRTVNGRTETIHKRRDAQGNEHITYSSPEGERYTINGVEQPQPGHSISAPPPPPTTFQTRPQSPPMINAPPPPLQPLFVPPPPQVTNYHTPPPQPQPQPQPQAHGGYNYNTPQSNQYSGASSNYPAQPTAHYSLPSASQTQPAPVPSRFTYPDPRRSHDRASYSGSSTQSGHGSRGKCYSL